MRRNKKLLLLHNIYRSIRSSVYLLFLSLFLSPSLLCAHSTQIYVNFECVRAGAQYFVSTLHVSKYTAEGSFRGTTNWRQPTSGARKIESLDRGEAEELRQQNEDVINNIGSVSDDKNTNFNSRSV